MSQVTDIAIGKASLIERIETLASNAQHFEILDIARTLRASTDDEAAAAATDDVVRATGLRLAAALSADERTKALEFVRRGPVAEVALMLPQWADRVAARAEAPAPVKLDAVPAYQLEQVAREIEAPTEALETAVRRLRRLNLELDAERAARSVDAAAESLRFLLNDLVDLASLSDGRFASARIDFHIRDCLVEALDGLRPRAERARVAFVLDVAANVPDAVVGDPGRLRQVLHTLAGNAIEAGTGGEVRVCVNSEAHEGRLQLDITVRARDDQTANAELRRDSGAWIWRGGARTGLGLAIARQLVERMGGRTWVGTAQDGRSEIHFTVVVDEPSELPQPDPSPSSKLSLQVLVIAAQTEPVDLLIEQLRGFDCRVRPETTVAAGRAWLQMHPTDVVLIVGSLATRRSAALVAEAAALGVEGGPPLALLVRSGHRGDAARCRQLGIGAYLGVPCSDRDLHDALRALVELGASNGRRSSQIGREALVTRHFLRESRRKLHVAWRSAGPSALGDLLHQLGHVLVARDAFDDADFVLIDASPCGANARQWLAEQLDELPETGRPPVLVVLSPDAAAQGVPADAPIDEILLAPVDHPSLVRVLPLLRGRGPKLVQTAVAVDVGEIAARIGGDETLARTVLAEVARCTPQLQARITAALAASDLIGAHHGARALGSALAHLGLRATSTVALELAGRCKAGDRNGAVELARELWPRLVAALDAVRTALDSESAARQHGVRGLSERAHSARATSPD